LLGPTKWTYFYLSVVLDIFSRYVVAWRLERRESATLAKELIETAIAREGADPTRLTIHADGGPSMTSKTLAQFYADLGVTKSRSRPHVSNDNPFSEAQFKTLKYGPGFPPFFGSIEQAREFCRAFFPWYNEQHRHTGLALLTPSDVHHGRVEERTDARRTVLLDAWKAHPERFVLGAPTPPVIEPIVYINRPEAAQHFSISGGLKPIDTFRSHIYASELGTPARVTAARFVPVPGFARDVPDAPALAQQVYYAVSIGHVQYVHGGALRAATLGGPEALHQVCDFELPTGWCAVLKCPWVCDFNCPPRL
jgi:hypothetical protein